MKKVVYTCLFSNGSTKPDTPFVKDKLPEFDYIIFTNIPDNCKNSGWSPIQRELLNNHPIYTAKYYKWTAHNYLLDYDVALYVDAYMSPNPKILWGNYISRLNINSITESLILMKHSQRDCIYEECNAIVHCRKDTRINMDKVINFLKTNNMPHHYGLSEGGLILRHLKNNDLNNFLEEFFNLMLQFSYRDQALLSYMFWKNNIKIPSEFTHDFYCKTGTMGHHNYT
jgi:hypothetical protein